MAAVGTEAAELITPGTIVAVTGALAAFGRWALRHWTQIRREGVEAARDAALRRESFEANQASFARADNARMVEALLANAKGSADLAASHTALAGKIDTLSAKLDNTRLDNLSNKLADIEEHLTPPMGYGVPEMPPDPPRAELSGRQIKHRTSPHGYYPPRAGTRDDDH
jgi:hypothetical protein